MPVSSNVEKCCAINIFCVQTAKCWRLIFYWIKLQNFGAALQRDNCIYINILYTKLKSLDSIGLPMTEDKMPLHSNRNYNNNTK